MRVVCPPEPLDGSVILVGLIVRLPGEVPRTRKQWTE